MAHLQAARATVVRAYGHGSCTHLGAVGAAFRPKTGPRNDDRVGDQEGKQAVQPHGREEQALSAKPLETSALSRSRGRLSASALSNVRILNASA